MWVDIDEDILNRVGPDERLVIEESAGRNRELYEAIFENRAYAVLFIDPLSHKFIDCNQMAIDILKAETKSHVKNMLPSSISPEFQPDGRKSEEKQHEMIQLAMEKGLHVFDWMIVQTDGKEIWIEVVLMKIKLHKKDLLLVNWKDINYKKEEEIIIRREVEQKTIELKLANEKLSKMAFYDPLTNIPNRRYFEEHLEIILPQAERDNKGIALFYIDLDGFKKINDSVGHKAGDKVLEAISCRFSRNLRVNDFIARIGGDEFCMAIYNYKSIGELESIAGRLVRECCLPVHAGEKDVRVSLSIGIALFPEHGSNFDDLLSMADSAMYEAKKDRTCSYVFASPGKQ